MPWQQGAQNWYVMPGPAPESLSPPQPAEDPPYYDLHTGGLQNFGDYTCQFWGPVMTQASFISAGGSPWTDVLAYGADPTGIVDSSSSIQGAINSLAGNGGIVFLPKGVYQVATTITVPSNIILVGVGWGINTAVANAKARTRLYTPVSLNGSIFSINGTNVTVTGIALTGNPAAGQSNTGITFVAGSYCSVEDCSLTNFGGSAIVINNGNDAHIFRHLYAQGLLNSTPPSSPTGIIDINSADHRFLDCDINGSIATGAGPGNIVGIYLRLNSANCWFTDTVAEFCQVGIWIQSGGSGLNRFSGVRSEWNNGQGWQIDTGSNTLQGCLSYANSQSTNNTSDGFVFTAPNNQLIACRDETPATNKTRYSFTDSSASGLNEYYACRGSVPGTGLVNFSGAGIKLWFGGQLSGNTAMLPLTPGSGITGNRPTAARNVGSMFFDTTLGIPIWWSGTAWVNASGATV